MAAPSLFDGGSVYIFIILSTRVIQVFTLSHIWNSSIFISLLGCVNVFIRSPPASCPPPGFSQAIRQHHLIPRVSSENLEALFCVALVTRSRTSQALANWLTSLNDLLPYLCYDFSGHKS